MMLSMASNGCAFLTWKQAIGKFPSVSKINSEQSFKLVLVNSLNLTSYHLVFAMALLLSCLMNSLLSGLSFSSCLAYLDDIIAFAKTWGEHSPASALSLTAFVSQELNSIPLNETLLEILIFPGPCCFLPWHLTWPFPSPSFFWYPRSDHPHPAEDFPWLNWLLLPRCSFFVLHCCPPLCLYQKG